MAPAVGAWSALGAIDPGPALVSTASPSTQAIDSLAQQAKLTSSAPLNFGYFGYSVAVSGDGNRAVVGARNENGAQAGAGAVYVFDRAGAAWTQTARLTASDGLSGDLLGYSVAISLDGTTVAAGAPNVSVGGVAGFGGVYVFTTSGGAWQQVDKVVASDGAGGAFFGSSVSISGNGDAIVAGAGSATVGNNVKQGAAYVFTRVAGYAWGQSAKLTASDGGASATLGLAVAISADGGSLAAAAPGATIGGKANQGAVYIFDRLGSGWSQQAKLVDPNGAGGNLMGLSVSMSSDGAVVLAGAPLATVGGNARQGTAHVFARTGASWSQPAKLTASDGAAFDSFGDSVSISADGTAAVVGAGGATVGGRLNQGAVYVFGKSGANWSQATKLAATGGGVNDSLGNAAAASLNGSTVLAGARTASSAGASFQGSAFVFFDATPISIRVNPGSRTATAGVPTTFTAASSLANAAVQWQVSAGVGAWTNIAGETNSWYTFTPTLADSGKRFRAVFTSGGQSATTASSQLTVVKTETFLRVSSSINPRRIGDPLNIIIDAIPAAPGAGVPDGGLISINIGASNYQGTLHNGKAVFSIPVLGPGSYLVTATYNGASDPIFGSATATMSQVIDRGTTTIAPGPGSPTRAPMGQPVTLSAVVSYEATHLVPNGGVMFLDGGSVIGFEQVRAEGGVLVASFTTTFATPGNHYLQVVYLGGDVAAPSSSAVYNLFVDGPGASGAASTAGAGGAVASPGDSPSSSLDDSSTLFVNATSPNAPIKLAAATPPVAQAAIVGIPTTFTAAPTNAATYSAQWQVSAGGGAWADIPGATNWWYTIKPSLAESGNRYRAVFSGGGQTETTSFAELSVVKSGTFLRVSSNLNPRRIGDPLNIVIDAIPAAPGAGVPDGGLISVNIGAINYQGTLHNGRAVFSIPPIGPGSYEVTATYNGASDPAFGSATATMRQIITRGATTIAPGPGSPTRAPMGQPVTLSAVVSYEATHLVPNGGVMFLDGGSVIGFEQVRAEGGVLVASFTTTFATPGNHYLQVVYLGGDVAAASSSTVYTVFVDGPGAGSASAPTRMAAAPLASTNGDGLAAALAFEEAVSQKTDDPFATQGGQTASSPALALPSAITARKLQQRYAAPYKAL